VRQCLRRCPCLRLRRSLCRPCPLRCPRLCRCPRSRRRSHRRSCRRSRRRSRPRISHPIDRTCRRQQSSLTPPAVIV
jgi:hypothetical protein